MPIFIVSSPSVAELAKLLENLYRDVNIALINEMAQICYASGIPIWEVIEAAATKPYGFQAFYPGPGVGGHCIPVDSVYYSFWGQEVGKQAVLAELARKINYSMPEYVIKRLKEFLKDKGKKLNRSKILILGVSYKKDIGDLREAPMLKVLNSLINLGVTVFYHDPLNPKIEIEKNLLRSIDLDERELIGEMDCVVLGVAHSFYRPGWLLNNCRLLFDLTGLMSSYRGRDNLILL